MLLTSAHLTLLAEIRKAGSLARAAANLDITAPAVSQQLARMEREVGAALVKRGARGATLTRLGQVLAEHGEHIVAELSAAAEAAADFMGLNDRRLRIGAFPSASVSLLPDVLASLRYRYPDAALSVIDLPSDAGPELVANDELDLAITASYGAAHRRTDVSFVHLMSDPLHIVAPDDHPVAATPCEQPVALADLSAEPWVSGIVDRPSRVQLENAAADLGFRPNLPFQTESYDVAQALVTSGVALALVPRLALIRRDSVVHRKPEPRLSRQIYAVVPAQEERTKLAQELLRILIDECQARFNGTAPSP